MSALTPTPEVTRRYRQGRATCRPYCEWLFEGVNTGRIKRRWLAALGRLNGNKTRGGFLGAPPSGATCMLIGQGFRRVRLHDDRVDLFGGHGAADEQFFRQRAYDMLTRSQ
jgi:hypothetical protein